MEQAMKGNEMRSKFVIVMVLAATLTGATTVDGLVESNGGAVVQAMNVEVRNPGPDPDMILPIAFPELRAFGPSDAPLLVAPASNGAHLKGIADWNELAGREILRASTDSNPDIDWVIKPPGDSSAYAYVRPKTQWYDGHCEIHYPSYSYDGTFLAMHELGHCLGLSDSFDAAYIEREDPHLGNNRRVCDLPDHPSYSSYSGVMSYCNGIGSPNAEDKSALMVLGFIVDTSNDTVVTSPAPEPTSSPTSEPPSEPPAEPSENPVIGVDEGSSIVGPDISVPGQRLAGATRIETSVAISQFQFPTGSRDIYIATATDFPDALAGGSLTNGPVLLVPSCGDLPQVVADEIVRLDVQTDADVNVIALGGVNAICDLMLTQALAVAGS